VLEWPQTGATYITARAGNSNNRQQGILIIANQLRPIAEVLASNLTEKFGLVVVVPISSTLFPGHCATLANFAH
jgi:hypothetical protein